jgi:hypothetical protein
MFPGDTVPNPRQSTSTHIILELLGDELVLYKPTLIDSSTHRSMFCFEDLLEVGCHKVIERFATMCCVACLELCPAPSLQASFMHELAIAMVSHCDAMDEDDSLSPLLGALLPSKRRSLLISDPQ